MMPISQAQERIKGAFSQQAIVKVNVVETKLHS